MPRTDAGWHTSGMGRFPVHTWIVILGGVILPIVLAGMLLTPRPPQLAASSFGSPDIVAAALT
jgi:hypothetical protein